MQLSWSAVAGATSYRVYWYSSTGWQQLATTGGTAIDFSQLTPGGTYTFDVAAVNAAGTGVGATPARITMP